jgi:hypothetical protein
MAYRRIMPQPKTKHDMATFTWTSRDFITLSKPCVYTIWKGDEAFYVGASANGLCRPLSRSHPLNVHLPDCTRVAAEFFDNAHAAFKHEAKLIKSLNPSFNGKRREIRRTKMTFASERCEGCRKEFAPKKPWQKYCSDTCRRLAWFEKNFQRKTA